MCLRSALTLLVLGVLADAHDFALALDDLALLAHGLNAGTHFHGLPSFRIGGHYKSSAFIATE
jgi:hypothetical protein